VKRKTKIKDKPKKKRLPDQPTHVQPDNNSGEMRATSEDKSVQTEADIAARNDAIYNDIFNRWDGEEFEPTDFTIDVPIDSLESAVGYTSLFRQFHQAFIRSVAFYQTPTGGSLSVEEARKASFHPCKNEEEAKKHFKTMMRLPFESLNFIDLEELHQVAPRVAERFWERAKDEGNKEFISGHLGANITFPVGYMKQLWNIARYLGVRDSFIAEWQPRGGIEVALIDMMTQSYFQWQYWLEQTVKRSQTGERSEHPEYARWMANRQAEYRANGWEDGYWFRPYVSEREALDQAVQMVDRFNRIFMRTLRQLRDLRRYAPLTINNPNQVNIATDGGQQVNLS
jgi:hypothetical protein